MLFYYYCDRYGILVMQDMVNSGKYNFFLDTVLPTVGVKKRFTFPASKKRRKLFISDSLKTLDFLHNNPCVIYYTIFNEGWGQFDTDNVYTLLKNYDSTRIFDSTSGWFFKKKSDVDSHHVYFKKLKLKAKGNRPLILSEFGGYSFKILEHSFNQKNTYGYKKFTTQKEFTSAMIDLYKNQVVPCIKNGEMAVFTSKEHSFYIKKI